MGRLHLDQAAFAWWVRELLQRTEPMRQGAYPQGEDVGFEGTALAQQQLGCLCSVRLSSTVDNHWSYNRGGNQA